MIKSVISCKNVTEKYDKRMLPSSQSLESMRKSIILKNKGEHHSNHGFSEHNIVMKYLLHLFFKAHKLLTILLPIRRLVI